MFGTAIVTAGIVGTAAFVKAYRHVRERRDVFKEMGLYELPEKGWVGGWTHWMQRKEDLFGLEIELIRKHGKVFGYFEGRQPCIMMADVDLLKQIMIKDFDSFHDRRNFIPKRDSPMDVQLQALSGERWRHVRQQLSPTFTPANMRRMEPLLKKVADQLERNIGNVADNGGAFDAKAYAGFFTLDVIASVAFALEIDSFNNQNSPFVVKARQVFAAVPLTGGFIASIMMFPDWMVKFMNWTPLWYMVRGLFQFFQDVVESEMDRRRKQEGGVVRHDFLATVMPAEKDPNDPANKPFVEFDELGDVWLKNGLTRKEIIGQAVLFFLAGYETTATTLTMALLALSENPDKQEKLYRELQSVFEKDGKDITMDTLAECKYLEMVLNETLRYYCPVLRVDRLSTEETTVNGLKIPKDVSIIIPVNAIHHDADLWPEPDKFEPERFADPENIVPGSFLPFGAGNRNCIGMRLAQLELKMALSRLVLNYKFRISPETELPIRWLPTAFRNPHCKVMLKPERRVRNN